MREELKCMLDEALLNDVARGCNLLVIYFSRIALPALFGDRRTKSSVHRRPCLSVVEPIAHNPSFFAGRRRVKFGRPYILATSLNMHLELRPDMIVTRF